MNDQWSILVENARAMMAERQQAALTQFGLNDSMQYEIDNEKAELVFISEGIPIALGEIQLIGSIAGTPPTWLWGWANDSVSSHTTRLLTQVRQFGQEHGFSKLTEPSWVPEDDEGHDMMAVSAAILDIPACFYSNHTGIDLFYAICSLRLLAHDP